MSDNRTLLERVNKFITKPSHTNCWLWSGQIHPSFGYGMLRYNVRKWTAHRATWTAYRGPIPRGMSVLHHCDVPNCVNPDHLYIGTQADNMRDRKVRNRYTPYYGDENQATRIPEKYVDEILQSNLPYAELAEIYGVTYAGIYFIKNGKRTSARGKKAVKPIKRPMKGENATFVILTEEQALYALHSPLPQHVIGTELGVSRSCIQSIKNRRTWKHLDNTQ